MGHKIMRPIIVERFPDDGVFEPIADKCFTVVFTHPNVSKKGSLTALDLSKMTPHQSTCRALASLLENNFP